MSTFRENRPWHNTVTLARQALAAITYFIKLIFTVLIREKSSNNAQLATMSNSLTSEL